MYEKLGSFVSRYWVFVIGAWIAAAAAIHSVAPRWEDITKDGDLAYLPARMTSVRGQQLYGEAFPDNRSRSEIVVVLERESGLEQADLDLAYEIADFFKPEPVEPVPGQVAPVEAPAPPQHRMAIVDVVRPIGNLKGEINGSADLVGQKLLSQDKKACIVVASLEHEFIAINSIGVLKTTRDLVNQKLAAAQSRADDPVSPGLKFGLTGSASVGGDTLIASDESIQNIHKATAVLVLIILLAVYRAPVVVFVPLITIGMAVFLAKDLVALLTQVQLIPGFEWFRFEIFKTSEIFIFTILFGSGTDFCLFLISRYREEMEHGLDKQEGLREALAQVGEALTGSALTTICGLSMMFFADFGKFTYSGPAIALCLFIALLACLTFAPAMMRGCGRLVFWPFGVKVQTHKVDVDAMPVSDGTLIGRFWAWSSDHILARPGAILVVALVLMTPFAVAGWKVQISYDLLADLPRDRDSVQGTKMLKRHFAAGETGPISMLAKLDGMNFDGDEGRERITELTKELYKLSESEITNVRSLTYPLGDPPKKKSIFGGGRDATLTHHRASKAKYVSLTGPRAGQVTRFDIIQVYDPFSPEAEGVLRKIEGFVKSKAGDPASPWYGATFDFIGTTAGTRDLKAVITSDEWRIQQLVVLAVFAVILAILRRPLICLYLIFTVVFSYLATMGATELAFAWAYGDDFSGLDWKVPIFLFVILVAVGEDYNIYLATRVFEEERRRGRMQGLRAAIMKTGGIITSCGVIMAGTFVSLMTGSLVAMLALGFALTLGVILDTFIVRPVLVPAFLAWLYRITPEPESEAKPVDGPASEEELLVSGSALLTESAAMPGKPHTELTNARRSMKR